MRQTNTPIFVSSVFKSGTWLIRKIITDLTGLPAIEPTIKPGFMDPCDPEYVYYTPGYYYSWHFVPTKEIREKIIRHHGKPVFLIRNIYDLVVSMYYHFAGNIDADIGRGANVDQYFSTVSKQDGMNAVVIGRDAKGFRWSGIGPHISQMEQMLLFAQTYPCFITTYERLNLQKKEELIRLSEFLEYPITNAEVDIIMQSSSFNTMKAEAIQKNAGSHFRNGKIKSHVDELNDDHIKNIDRELSIYAPRLQKLITEFGLNEILELDQLGNDDCVNMLPG